MGARIRTSVCLLVLIVGALGWGQTGHRVIAQIAYQYLSTSATTAVDKLLTSDITLPDIANWPDQYADTSEGKWSESLHFVNLPQDATSFEMSACDEGCVVTAYQNYSKRLASGEGTNCSLYETRADQPCPLSFVTHFAGDAHQPLHVAFAIDRGGVYYNVYYNGASISLHKLWDYGLINYVYPESDWAEYGKDLLSYMDDNPSIVQELASVTDVASWANESFQYARTVCYNLMPGTVPLEVDGMPTEGFPQVPLPRARGPLTSIFSDARDPEACAPEIDSTYAKRNMQHINLRLIAAGIRLATALNNMFS